MIISEGRFPFCWGSFLFYLDGNIPPSLIVMNSLALEWADSAELPWLIKFYFLPQLIPTPLIKKKKNCHISSRTGNPLDVGRCKCVMVWLQIPLGPLDPRRLWSDGLFVSATMTFVLPSVVKLLASKLVNVFENLPMCFVGFVCPEVGWAWSRTLSQLREMSWGCVSAPGLGRAQPGKAVCSIEKSQGMETLSVLLCVNQF